jgi:C-terminal processing protease CtpA/Prc
MFKKALLIVLLLLVSFLGGCGGGSGNGADQGFSAAERSFLYSLFKSEYLWYDQVASNVETSGFQSPQEMINTLRVNPPDKWSTMITTQQYENYANQQTAGFGFGYTSDMYIFLVRINAPAYHKLYRGDHILLINGESATPTLIAQASSNLNVPTTFTVERNSTQLDVTVTPASYTFNVSLGKVIDRNGIKVGYLRYDAFTESSVAEFEQIFTDFTAAGVNELVIDMRYNGGGDLSVASALLDNITAAHPGARQFYLDWNANYQQNNTPYNFELASSQDGNELNATRIFFLVTRNSASASEAVINALIPYLGSSNVITIGEDTHGKPVGMRGRIYGSHIYFLINFLIRNNSGATTSFNGITPTCLATDDITHTMGDENETMLAAALYYIENDTCP